MHFQLSVWTTCILKLIWSTASEVTQSWVGGILSFIYLMNQSAKRARTYTHSTYFYAHKLFLLNASNNTDERKWMHGFYVPFFLLLDRKFQWKRHRPNDERTKEQQKTSWWALINGFYCSTFICLANEILRCRKSHNNNNNNNSIQRNICVLFFV